MADPVARVCFVCLGNICRSPTAEGVFAERATVAGIRDRLTIDSAGTGGWHEGERADPRSRAAAQARGFDLPSRARKFTVADFAAFDVIAVMDRSNRTNVLALAKSPSDESKVVMFRAFDPEGGPDAEVPDPYYGGEDGFETVLDMCERASDGLMEHLRERFPSLRDR